MRQRKIVLTIVEPLLTILEGVERELNEKDNKIKLSDYLNACLESSHEESLRYDDHKVTTSDLVDVIRKESNVLLRDAKIESAKGNDDKARSLVLKSISYELEALSYLNEISDSETVSSLVIILNLLKDAFGLRHLPRV